MKTNRNIISTIISFMFPALSVARMWVDDPDGETVDGGGTPNREDGTSGTIGNGNDDRLALYQRIADANDLGRAGELRDVNDDETTSEFEPDVTEEARALAAQRAEDDVDPAGAATEVDADDPNDDVVVVDPVIDAPVVTKIKVNGKEIELTPELIEKAQKIASADEYLEQASTARRTPAPAPVENTAPATPSRDVEAERAEEDLALVRAIQVGTEEEAVAALRKIRSGAAGSPDVVARTVDERLNFQRAMDWFETEYADIVEDPHLNALVQQLDSKLIGEGDKRSYRDRYKHVGDEIRAYRDDQLKKWADKAGLIAKPAAGTPPAAPTPQVKIERKAALPSTPVRASGKAASKPADEDDGEENASDVIAKMAAQRGGPQWQRA